MRLGWEVVLNIFGLRTALGRLVVVEMPLLEDFDPIDRNLDFFDEGFDVTERRPKLDLLFCLVAWKLFGPRFELGGFLKPNLCWDLLVGLLLLAVLL